MIMSGIRRKIYKYFYRLCKRAKIHEQCAYPCFNAVEAHGAVGSSQIRVIVKGFSIFFYPAFRKNIIDVSCKHNPSTGLLKSHLSRNKYILRPFNILVPIIFHIWKCNNSQPDHLTNPINVWFLKLRSQDFSV